MAAAALASLYLAWQPRASIVTTSVYSSELAKLVANAMLAQRVSSINAASALCERTGADVREVARAVGLDHRIGSRFLRPGLGFGGSCFRKDLASLVYLADTVGLPDVALYWQQVLLMNDFQRARFSAKLVAAFDGCLAGRKIALLGFAFKGSTADTRDTPAADVVRALLAAQPGQLALYDPCCSRAAIEQEIASRCRRPTLRDCDNGDLVVVESDPYTACAGAAAVCILTDWPHFAASGAWSERSDSSSCQNEQAGLHEPVLDASCHNEQAGLHEPVLDASCQNEQAGLLGPVSDEGLRASRDRRACRVSGISPDQLRPEPECAAGCAACAGEGDAAAAAASATAQLDWRKVAHGMVGPKYVFDGRGMTDPAVLRPLGITVEGLGWSGTVQL